jgi:hypothetical protein
MTRPEFKLKMDLAGVFGFFKGFGADMSVWQLTAAQRTILLGPDKEQKGKKPKKLYKMAELRALTEANKDRLGIIDPDSELSVQESFA